MKFDHRCPLEKIHYWPPWKKPFRRPWLHLW